MKDEKKERTVWTLWSPILKTCQPCGHLRTNHCLRAIHRY